jgi:hypothetical protein
MASVGMLRWVPENKHMANQKIKFAKMRTYIGGKIANNLQVMKKTGWLLVLMFMVAKGLSAQTFDEWFEQNSTQLKYLALQIAALDGYAGVLEDGYRITGNGLSGIAGIQAADTAMHGQYFESLEVVSPAVRADPRVAGIKQYCQAVEQLAALIAAAGTAMDGKIAANLEAACEQDLGWLDLLLTDGDLGLEDAERLRLIGKLYGEARARFGFAVEVLANR